MRYETFRILYGHVCLWLCLAILLVYWKQSITVGIRYSVISRCNKDRLQFTSTASKKKSLTAWRFLTWVPPFQGKIYYQRCNHKTTLSLPDLIIVCRISDFGQSVKKIGRSESLTCQTLFGQPDSDIRPTRKTSGSGAWLEAVGRGLRQWGVAWGSGAWLEACIVVKHGVVGRGLRQWGVAWGSGAWLEAVGRGLRQWGVAWGSGAWLEACIVVKHGQWGVAWGSGAWLEAVGRGLRQWGVAWGSGAWLEACIVGSYDSVKM